MANETLTQLRDRWKRESDVAQARAIASGLPENAVTKEYMRLLVLEWWTEIWDAMCIPEIK